MLRKTAALATRRRAPGLEEGKAAAESKVFSPEDCVRVPSLQTQTGKIFSNKRTNAQLVEAAMGSRVVRMPEPVGTTQNEELRYLYMPVGEAIERFGVLSQAQQQVLINYTKKRIFKFEDEAKELFLKIAIERYGKRAWLRARSERTDRGKAFWQRVLELLSQSMVREYSDDLLQAEGAERGYASTVSSTVKEKARGMADRPLESPDLFGDPAEGGDGLAKRLREPAFRRQPNKFDYSVPEVQEVAGPQRAASEVEMEAKVGGEKEHEFEFDQALSQSRRGKFNDPSAPVENRMEFADGSEEGDLFEYGEDDEEMALLAAEFEQEFADDSED